MEPDLHRCLISQDCRHPWMDRGHYLVGLSSDDDEPVGLIVDACQQHRLFSLLVEGEETAIHTTPFCLSPFDKASEWHHTAASLEVVLPGRQAIHCFCPCITHQFAISTAFDTPSFDSQHRVFAIQDDSREKLVGEDFPCIGVWVFPLSGCIS